MGRAKTATVSVVAVRTLVVGPAEIVPPGATVDLPAQEAERLVREGHARPGPVARSAPRRAGAGGEDGRGRRRMNDAARFAVARAGARAAVDGIMGEAAVYTPASGASAAEARVRLRRPDVATDWRGTAVASDSVMIDVAASMAPRLARKDRFAIAGRVYEVTGEPARDGRRESWTAEAREL